MLNKEELRNLETVRLMWATIQDPTRRDLDSYEGFLHTEHVWTSDTVRFDASTGQFTLTGKRLELQGARLARALMELYVAAFPDLFFDQIVSIVQGDTVASRWHGTGTHRGDFMGVAPTGRVGEVMGASFYTVVDGKIDKTDVYWDVSVLLRQIGWEGWSGPSHSAVRVPAFVGGRTQGTRRYEQEVEAVLTLMGVPGGDSTLKLTPPQDSSYLWESPEEVKPMKQTSGWPRPFSNYRTAELRVMKFPSMKESDRATLLCWEDSDLWGVPRRHADGKNLIVPEEAIALFKARGIKFKVDTLLDQDDLSPERRAELRRQYGL